MQASQEVAAILAVCKFIFLDSRDSRFCYGHAWLKGQKSGKCDHKSHGLRTVIEPTRLPPKPGDLCEIKYWYTAVHFFQLVNRHAPFGQMSDVNIPRAIHQ